VVVRRDSISHYITRAWVFVPWGGAFVNAGSVDPASGGAHIVLLGDVDGTDGADLVTAYFRDSRSVDWTVRSSDQCTGTCFQATGVSAATGAGDAGDYFRLGDGDRDGKMDLFYGRPVGLMSSPPDPTQVKWYGRLARQRSSGIWGFPSYTVWAEDAGNDLDLFQ
jgi:hypothetical protein